jgi:hypothetical protein
MQPDQGDHYNSQRRVPSEMNQTGSSKTLGAPGLDFETWEPSFLNYLFHCRVKSAGSIFWPLFSFVTHQFIGTIGVILFSNLLVSALFMLAHVWNPSLTFKRAYWILTEVPGFPAQAALGLLLGFVLAKFVRRRVMVWTWVLPLALFCFVVVISPIHSSLIFHYFIGSGCSPKNHCFDQFVTTMPLVASAAYSLGAKLSGNHQPQRASVPQEQAS